MTPRELIDFWVSEGWRHDPPYATGRWCDFMGYPRSKGRWRAGGRATSHAITLAQYYPDEFVTWMTAERLTGGESDLEKDDGT